MLLAFDLVHYDAPAAAWLARHGSGYREMSLEAGASPALPAELAQGGARDWFPTAAHPTGALAGLYLYAGAWTAAHALAQDDSSREGSYWHAIVHRQEPDPGNAAYWFRRAGRHPVFEPLAEAAAHLATQFPGARWKPETHWNPDAFVQYCGAAAHSAQPDPERFARAVQLAEWQLLFDFCARPASTQR